MIAGAVGEPRAEWGPKGCRPCRNIEVGRNRHATNQCLRSWVSRQRRNLAGLAADLRLRNGAAEGSAAARFPIRSNAQPPFADYGRELIRPCRCDWAVLTIEENVLRST